LKITTVKRKHMNKLSDWIDSLPELHWEESGIFDLIYVPISHWGLFPVYTECCD
jgi:hypothetical protein